MTQARSVPDGDAPAPGPLSGFAIGVTADRRRAELATLLERRGAQVLRAPTMSTVPLPEDGQVREATEACLAAPVDAVVATTGVGFTGWLEAASAWGEGEELTRRLAATRVLARGPKARGAVRAAGLAEEWSPAGETSDEILDYLLTRGVQGRRVAVQLHGQPLPEFVAALERAGANVIQVPVYRWDRPEDVAAVRRLTADITRRRVDAVTFTSAPAVSGLLQIAAEAGRREATLDAFRGEVVPACVGPVTASPLDERGVSSLQPHRSRTRALVEALTDELTTRRVRTVTIGDRVLEIRGRGVVVDGRLLPLSAAPMAVLRVLAERPGHVVSRFRLRASLPSGDAGDHAVNAAVSQLRSALGEPDLVRTVVKRGYSLACEPVDP